MTVFRIEITKEEQLRYISHLDYANLLQRAIRRAGLPAAYSEGFNPHMKVSFASAMAVGVTADAEYADVELINNICQPEFFDKLKAVLPAGMKLLRAKEITSGRHQSMNALVDTALYEMKFPDDITAGELQTAVDQFNAAPTLIFVREKQGKGAKKGRIIKKEIDIKQFLASALTAGEADNVVLAAIKVSPLGSIKPIEIINALKINYLPTLDSNAVLINRKTLSAGGKNLMDLI